MLVSPVGPNIFIQGITTNRRPRHIYASSVNQVDLDWLVDSAMSDEDAIKFVFQTVVSRDPTGEELARIFEFFESKTMDRRERFDVVHRLVHQADFALTHGIYEFQDDRLVVCLATPGQPRPKVFDSGKDGGQILLTFKRAPPENKSP